MHARMVVALTTLVRVRGEADEARPPPTAARNDAEKAGLRTLELDPCGSACIAFPSREDSVALDALGFDYRCGGSAGIANRCWLTGFP
jgi:hypothetical protein